LGKGSTFQTCSGSFFDRFKAFLSRGDPRSIRDIDIKDALEIVDDIKKNTQWRHDCAELTFNTRMTIIQGFLEDVGDRDLIRLRNEFLRRTRPRECRTSGEMWIHDLTQQSDAMKLVDGGSNDLANLKIILKCLNKIVREVQIEFT
jgi:hypothetical protein